MKTTLIFVACLLALACASLPQRKTYQKIHPCVRAGSCASHDFKRVGPAKKDHVIHLTFAVTLKNLDVLEKVLYSVSDPTSPEYGNHWTMEQVDELVLDQNDMKAVRKFLVSHKGVSVTRVYSSGFIAVKGPVAAFEKMLTTKFFVYESAELSHKIVRTPVYSLPAHIAAKVDTVTGTTQFPATSSLRQLPTRKLVSSPQEDGSVTPQTITSVYGVSYSFTPNATQSVFEALGQDYSPDDLTAFQRKYNLPEQGIAGVIGPNDPSACSNPNSCIEANLDVQYIIAVAPGAPTYFWSISQSAQDPFLTWAMAVGSDNNAPLVHSISYGAVESELPQSDMTRFNTEMQKLGVRGLTVFIASGDDGVANYIARSDPSQCGFNPSFPATSPYVTAVGATMGPESGKTEVACTSDNGGGITTGGGFSGVFDRPSYQDSAVQNYLNNGPNMPPSGQYNGQGRGYPDVAVLGYNYNIAIGGQFYTGSGTSASTPVFAAMVSLVNSARAINGQASVGFLNPALYNSNMTGVFRDVTSGENNCCAGEQGQAVCCDYGFTATNGWDPLTGFGSISFSSFFDALCSGC